MIPNGFGGKRDAISRSESQKGYIYVQLFNDAVSSSVYTASNARMISE